MVTIGILSLQGGFLKHRQAVEACGVTALFVRDTADLDRIHGLIIPGGESTTIGKLLVSFNLLSPLQERIERGMPVYGTCAGLILLSDEIEGRPEQTRIGGLSVITSRNAYGRQIDSFETEIEVPALGTPPFAGVFIRAPKIVAVSENVEILARYEDAPVMVQQDHLLGTSFHPELTGDNRVHRYFIEMVKRRT